MYYLAETLSSTRIKFVGQDENLDEAKRLAYEHSYRTGLTVEVQTEQGKILYSTFAWKDR